MNASLEASWGAQCVGESKTPTSSRRRTESHTEPKNPERRLTHPEQVPEWLSGDLNPFFIPWGYDWKTKGVLNVPPSFRVEKAPKAPTVIISQVSETISTQSPAASGCVRKRETPNTEALGLYVSGGFECNGDLLYWTSANRRFRDSD